MSRFDFRGGIAPIRTAEELSLILPIVILFIVDGSVQPRFPNTDRSSPSPWVSVILVREGENPPTNFPIYFHWTQWNRLVVPLLKEKQTYSWRGGITGFGELLVLLNNVVGACGTVIFPKGEVFGSTPSSSKESVGRLYGCDPSDLERVGGKTLEYLLNMRERVLTNAQALGY